MKKREWAMLATVLLVAVLLQGCLSPCVTEAKYASEAIPVVANLRTKVGLYQYEKGTLPCVVTNEVVNGEDTGKVISPQIETWISADQGTAAVSANPSEAYVYKMASCALPSGEPSLKGLVVIDPATCLDVKSRHLGVLVDIDPLDLLGKQSRPNDYQYLVMRNGRGCWVYFLGCFGDGNGMPKGTGYAVCEIIAKNRKYIGIWKRYKSVGKTPANEEVQACFTSSTARPAGDTNPSHTFGCFVPDKASFDKLAEVNGGLEIIETMKKYGWDFGDQGQEKDDKKGTDVDAINERKAKPLERTCASGETKIGDCTWKYTVSGTNATIIGVTPASGDLEIPAEITVGCNTYVVTSIGNHAFDNANGKKVDLTSVTIPDSVTNIGALAFQCCRRLTAVKIGVGWTRYDRWVFNGCRMVKSFEVAKGNPAYTSVNGLLLTKDGRTLIQGVNGNVTIPETVTRIKEDAFAGCDNLLSIDVAGSNPVYTSDNGLLLTKDGRTVVRGVDGDVVIPDGIANIADGAFEGRGGLTSVTIPSGVTNVGRRAFWHCRRLVKVMMPDSVKGIGHGAFDGCDRLISVTIPVGVTNIGAGVFSGCHALNDFTVSSDNANYTFANGLLLSKDGKTLVAGVMVENEMSIPNSVTRIEDSAFRACNNLSYVTIPNGITDIGKSVFSQCDNLTGMTIPNSVTNIGDFAICDCRCLESIELPDSVTRIGRQAFYGSGFTNFKIPDSVIYIGNRAFWGCFNLETMTIGRAVRRLDNGALSYCSSLKRVTFLGNAPVLGDGVFLGVPSDCIVEVPCNSTGWGVDIPGKWHGMTIRYHQ